MRNTDMMCPAGVVLTVALVCSPAVIADASNGANDSMDAEAIMMATSLRYAELQSLHQKCTWSHGPIEGEEPSNYHFVELTQTSEMFFKRPSRLHILDDNFELFSDGETMYVVDRARDTYTMGVPPEQLTNFSQLIDTGASLLFDETNRLALSLLFPDQPSSDCAPDPLSEEIHLEVMEAERDGIPGWLVSDRSTGDQGPASNYWISAATGLIHRWELLATTTYRGEPDDPNDDVTGLSRIIIECSVVEPNPALDDELFEFKPTQDMRLVDNISPWFGETAGMSFEENIAATVSLSEGSVGHINPELLASVGSFRTGRAGGPRPGDRIDLDLDGTTDLVLPGHSGEVLIVDGATGETRVLRISGRAAGGNISRLRMAPIEGDTAWVVASTHYDEDYENSRTVFSLHGPDGEEWWVFSPELPDGQSSEGSTVVADLDHDGNQEIVVGIKMFSRVSVGRESYQHEQHDSLLVILDMQGERLSQRVVKGALIELLVGGSQLDPLIVAVFSDRVVTYRYSETGIE